MRFTLMPVLFGLITALFLSVASFGQDSKDQAATAELPTILFVCEHGAAKSVIAAAYFDKLAKERGLKYRTIFRGTNPDPTLAQAAEKGLKEDGVNTHGWKPEIVTKKDMDAASRIVAMGCALPGKDAVEGKVEEWNDISSVSQNYQVARNEIVRKVQSLVDDLAKKEQEAKGRQTKIDFNKDKAGSPRPSAQRRRANLREEEQSAFRAVEHAARDGAELPFHRLPERREAL